MYDIQKSVQTGLFKTPFYLYDLDETQKNYAALSSALSERFKIYYSMKANPHPEVLKKMLALGSGIDVSSLGELKKALAAGFHPSNMSYVGPAKTEVELKEILKNKVGYIVIESIAELDSLIRLTTDTKQTAKFCVRVNPRRYINSTGARCDSVPSHFGIDEDQILDLKNYDFANCKFAGLHFYLHSQFLNAAHMIENFSHFADIAIQMQNAFGTQFEVINFGGGFGASYFKNQPKLDLNALALLTQGFLTGKAAQLKDAKFFVESGRYLLASAGVFVTKILHAKKSYGKYFYVCDGGFSQNQMATGAGQLLRKNFPIEVLQKLSPNEKQTFSLVGPSCYSMDILAADVELTKPSPGDLVVIHQMGAYGPSFSPQNFLSRDAAQEYIIGS